MGAGDLSATGDHQLLEDLPIFALVDGLEVGANQLDVVFLQDAVLVQFDRRVESGLAAQGWQDGIRPLLGDDRLDDLPGNRLDIGGIGEIGIGHDGGRIRVYQDDAHPLLAQNAARLRTGVIELAGLTDDDGTGSDHQDGLYVVALRHYLLSFCWWETTMSRNRSKR